MDENLTDSERIEQIKQFLRENGWFMIGGLAVGALLVVGWMQYSGYRERRAEDAGALYQTVKLAIDSKDLPQATTTLTRMRSEFSSSAYTSQAGLLVARGHPEAAVAEFERALALRPDADDIRLDLARALESAGRVAEARIEYGRLAVARETPGDIKKAAKARLR